MCLCVHVHSLFTCCPFAMAVSIPWPSCDCVYKYTLPIWAWSRSLGDTTRRSKPHNNPTHSSQQTAKQQTTKQTNRKTKCLQWYINVHTYLPFHYFDYYSHNHWSLSNLCIITTTTTTTNIKATECIVQWQCIFTYHIGDMVNRFKRLHTIIDISCPLSIWISESSSQLPWYYIYWLTAV